MSFQCCSNINNQYGKINKNSTYISMCSILFQYCSNINNQCRRINIDTTSTKLTFQYSTL